MAVAVPHLLPHAGQNVDPSGICAPHLLQNISFFSYLCHKPIKICLSDITLIFIQFFYMDLVICFTVELHLRCSQPISNTFYRQIFSSFLGALPRSNRYASWNPMFRIVPTYLSALIPMYLAVSTSCPPRYSRWSQPFNMVCACAGVIVKYHPDKFLGMKQSLSKQE